MSENETPRRRGRPATGGTPKRNIRVGNDWDTGEKLAARLGMSMSDYVRDAIGRRNAAALRELARRHNQP
jgi:hypothetical protein